MANILDISPRLLRLFVELCETSSVSRSAENLGLSQPAASRGLALLRDALKDPLFVQSGRNIRPTSTALRLEPQIRTLLVDIESLPNSPDIQPEEMGGVVRIATTDYGAIVGLGSVIQEIQNSAPNLGIEIVPLDLQVFNRLLDGRVDLAFFADDPVPSGINFVDLFVDDYVYVVADSHPLARRRKLTVKDIEAYPRLLATIFGDRHKYVDESALGSANVGLWIPYFAAAPLILAESHMVMVIPTRAASFLRNTTKLVTLPIAPSAEPFTYRILWADCSTKDPIIGWLRDQFVQQLKSLP